MKILAVVKLAPQADRQAVFDGLHEELRGSWSLFAEGVMREAYQTEDPGQVVFVLEAADLSAANATLQRLPMVRLGQFEIRLTELRPFANWARLFAQQS